VGDSADAFYIKLVTARPSHKPIVEMLTELRVLLLNRYGAKGVDFDVHCCVATHHLAVTSQTSLAFCLWCNVLGVCF
jgi:hypothetical protein